MNGLEHISQTFANARAEGRAALMPYFTLGYPTPEDSLPILQAIAEAGADLIELGIPFSDPLADGPTIQRSTQVALERGMTLGRALEITAELRSCQVSQPLLLMGYYNPILAYGVERFVRQAASAGVDGFIIPDLPPEEAAALEAACRASQCALVYLLAPTSTPERTAVIAARTSGFLYLVSVVGVTGSARKPCDRPGIFPQPGTPRIQRTSGSGLWNFDTRPSSDGGPPGGRGDRRVGADRGSFRVSSTGRGGCSVREKPAQGTRTRARQAQEQPPHPAHGLGYGARAGGRDGQLSTLNVTKDTNR